jgi:hypothetical protein
MGGNWTFEIKLDGYRCIAVKRAREVTLFSRHKKVLNKRFPEIAQALASLEGDFVLDGELVASDSQGLLRHFNFYKAIPRRIFQLCLRLRFTASKWQTFAELAIERRLDQPLPAFTACCSHHGGYTP